MSFDWSQIRLAVFDVDGTLYRQRPLRLRMARELVWHTLKTGDLSALRVVMSYRRIRERMGDEETIDFAAKTIEATAKATGVANADVAKIVNHWIESHPLPYLAKCRYPGLEELFRRLKDRGIIVGVFSDYPAIEKLKHLGLVADFVITADEVGVLKPHPAGLERLMSQAKVGADQTVMIGDRVERDGEVARRVGAQALIRSTSPQQGWRTFASYADPVFAPILSGK